MVPTPLGNAPAAVTSTPSTVERRIDPAGEAATTCSRLHVFARQSGLLERTFIDMSRYFPPSRKRNLIWCGGNVPISPTRGFRRTGVWPDSVQVPAGRSI
jgi:hypothetical protein